MAIETKHQALDAGIIQALRVDGRASIQEISASLGVPRGSVSNRLKTLLDTGAVRVFAAFDPGFAGQHVIAHSMVQIDGPITEIANKIARFTESVFVSIVSGTYSLVFESRHADTEALEGLLATVRNLVGVRRVHTAAYTDVLNGFFVAHYRDDVSIDSTDLEVIGYLQDDGRASYRELAERTGLAPSSVRSRVSRLVAANVIRISAVESRTDSQSRLSIGVGITSRGDDDTVAELLRNHPRIDFSVRSLGRFNFIATITDRSTRALHYIIEEIRALPEVTGIESWSHLTVLKEDYERTINRASVTSKPTPQART